MVNYDYYAVTDRITEQLAKAGYIDWKKRIDTAVAAGSTGTEILMSIRWNFRELLDSGIRLDKAVESQIIELNRKINEALKP